MAEEIRYNFTGDASDLQAAAQKAKEALQEVANAEKQVDTTANFDKQASSIQSLTNYYNILKNSVNAYSQALSMNSSYTSQFVSSLQSAQSTIAGFLPSVSSALGNLNVTFEGLTQGMMRQQMSTQQLTQAYVSLPTSIAGLIPASTSAVTALSTLSKTTNDVKNSIDFTQSSLNRFDSALSTNSSYTSQAVKSFQKGEGELSKLQQAYIQTQNAAKSHNNTSKQTVQATNNASKGFNNLKNTLSSLPGPMNVAGASASKLFSKLMQLVSLRELFGLFKNLVKYSNDYIESMNLFVVSSTGYYESMKANADILSYYAGVTQTTIADAAGQFKLLATEMGVTSDKAAKMSNSLVNLAVDLSSLFNRDFEDVMENLESGLQGMTRAVRKYGIDLTEAGIAETAAQLGIQKKTAAMTQAEKMQLRYIRILQQTNLAQGDFARTIQTPANLLKILKDQIKETAVALGNLFYPILNTVLPALITFTLVIQNLAKNLATLFGIDTTEKLIDPSEFKDLEKSTAAAASNMDDAASSSKKMKQQVQGFDELNNLSTSTSSSSGAGDTGTGGSISIDIPAYDNMLSLSNFLPNLRKQADELYNSFASWAAPIKTAFEGIKEPITTAFNSIKASFGNLGKTFTDLIQKDLIQNVAPGLEKLAPVIASLTSNFSQLFQAISPILLTLGGFVWDIVTAALGLISPIVGKIAGAFQEWQGPLDTTFQTLREGLGEVFTSLGSMIMPILDTLLPVLMSLFTGIMPPLMDAVKVVVNLMVDLHRTLWPIVSCLIELLAPILEVIINIISAVVGIIAPIISILLKVLNFVLAPIVAILKVIISVISAVLKTVSAVVQGIQKAFGSLFQWLDKKITKVLNGFIDFLNKLLGGVEKGINFVLKGVNGVIKWINKIPGFNISELHVSIPKIPRFELGGFPEDGLFFANHNELVGQFSNGSTAVANNEQIIAGIEGGVERGMAKALGRNGTSRDVAQANIYIDGDLLFRKMIEYNNSYKRRTGKSAFA